MNLNPAVLGMIRGLGVAVLMAVLTYLGDATHLQGILNPQVAAILAAIVLGIEHNMEANGSGSLFGAAKRS